MNQLEIQEIFERIKHEVSRFEGKTVLITGCGGFLGRIFTHFFLYINKHLKSPCKVLGLDSFIVNLPKIDIDDKNFTFFNHDISVPITSKIDGNVDFIIACHGIADPKIYVQYNKEVLDGAYFGSFNLLDLAKERKSESVVLFSSSEIIGGFADTIVPTPELNSACFPIKGERCAYDCSKLLSIVIGDIFYRKYGVNVKNVLPFNVYSSNLSLKDKRVLASFMSKAVNGQPLTVYGEGSETRTMVHAVDFIYGCLLVLLNGKSNQHYNIGNDKPEISMKDLAYLVAKITGATVEFVKADPVYANQPKRRCPDISLARKELGYEPKISLEEGIRRYWEYVKSL